MKKNTRATSSPEFRLEAAQLVVDQGRTMRDAADAMGVGYSKWISGLGSFVRSAKARARKRRQ